MYPVYTYVYIYIYISVTQWSIDFTVYSSVFHHFLLGKPSQTYQERFVEGHHQEHFNLRVSGAWLRGCCLGWHQSNIMANPVASDIFLYISCPSKSDLMLSDFKYNICLLLGTVILRRLGVSSSDQKEPRHLAHEVDLKTCEKLAERWCSDRNFKTPVLSFCACFCLFFLLLPFLFR